MLLWNPCTTSHPHPGRTLLKSLLCSLRLLSPCVCGRGKAAPGFLLRVSRPHHPRLLPSPPTPPGHSQPRERSRWLTTALQHLLPCSWDFSVRRCSFQYPGPTFTPATAHLPRNPATVHGHDPGLSLPRCSPSVNTVSKRRFQQPPSVFPARSSNIPIPPSCALPGSRSPGTSPVSASLSAALPSVPSLPSLARRCNRAHTSAYTASPLVLVFRVLTRPNSNPA